MEQASKTVNALPLPKDLTLIGSDCETIYALSELSKTIEQSANNKWRLTAIYNTNRGKLAKSLTGKR